MQRLVRLVKGFQFLQAPGSFGSQFDSLAHVTDNGKDERASDGSVADRVQ